MRIGFNVHPYAMHLKGGGEIQLLRYIETLEKRGIDCIRHDIWDPKFDQMDLMHHFHLISGGIPILDYLRNLGIKTIVNTNMWVDTSNKDIVNKTEIENFLHIADYFVANSNLEVENILNFFDVSPDKARVIYNGVDPSVADPVDISLFTRLLPFTGEYVLNVANIEPRKNQIQLLKAAHSLGLPLVCIGSVRDKTFYEQLLNMSGHFYHIGPFSHNSKILRAAFQHASVFALPSLFETPGLAALEAAACNCQIVITGQGSTKEYFGTGAIYVDPSCADSIKHGLDQALNNKKVHNEVMGHVTANFSWSKIGSDLENLYSDILNR